MLRLTSFLLVAAFAALAQHGAATKYHIRGTVVNAITGDPIPSAQLTVAEAQHTIPIANVIATEKGQFSFENLPPGKYSVFAGARGFVGQHFEQHENFWTGIVIGPEIDSGHVIFKLSPDASITGTVLDEENEPVRNAPVKLFRTALSNGRTTTELAQQTTADDRGVYLLSHLQPGAYFVAVTARPWYAQSFGTGPVSDQTQFAGGDSSQEQASQPEFDVAYPVTFYPGTPDFNAATSITLKPGDRTVAGIGLTPVSALHVRVTGFEQGAVSANLFQQIGDSRLQIQAPITTTDKGETYISGIAPGQFDLALQSWGRTPYSRESQMMISDNAQIDVAETTALPALSGNVVLDSGKPLPKGTFLVFRNTKFGQSFGAPVSEEGKFEVVGQGILPGEYEIFAGGIPNALVRSLSAEGAAVTGLQLELKPGETVNLTVILSLGSGRIDGTAMRDGNPVSGAMIVLVPQDIEHNSTLVRRDQSDSDGTFTLFGVLPGKYTIVALEGGWDLQWINPGVLQPYLADGTLTDVQAKGNYKIEVQVQ